MSLAETAIKKKTVTGFTTVVLLLAGALSYTSLGQLEDPEFTVKSANIMTTYPGADAQEVELEVTDRIEKAIQEMPQVKYIESLSRAGLSVITVNLWPKYTSEKLPQIWDELRKKVGDVNDLPPGTGTPVVGDDFGDVYGFLLAMTGEGYTPAEVEDYADMMKKELSLVPGVARVELWGVQKRCIYLDVSETQLSQLGISMETLQQTLLSQNLVVDSGGLDLPTDRLRIEQTGAFTSPKDIEDLVIRGAGISELVAEDTTTAVASAGEELMRIGDIGTVRRGYVEPPNTMMRYNGKPALGISISNVSGVNIVDLGVALDKKLDDLSAIMPIGIEVAQISWQSEQVTQSINDFMVSLAQAVAIVIGVLWLAMGFRTSMIVGMCGLVFTIIMSFLVMALLGIDLQRMSLGALVIAMGMMVDNAIVVVDGIMVRIEKGMDRTKAAIEAATQPSIPLLGATVIAVMAFYPIYASDESAGEYCESLFLVVAISLMLSWVLSVTITPLMCIWLLPEPKAGGEDPYGGKFFGMFRGVLGIAMRFRWPVMGGVVALLVVAMIGFGSVDRTFFPDSARLQVMIDYWAPEGTKIQKVSADLYEIEKRLLEDTDKVVSVSTFMGQGPPRFYLPVDPEKPYQSYGQLIVNVKDAAALNAFIPEADERLQANVPQALMIVRRYGLGPSETWKVEARISGPGNADLKKMREMGEQGEDIFAESSYAKMTRTNWRQRVKKVNLPYDQERARWTRISRSDVARATKRGYDGYAVGQYREADKLYPILLRHVEAERQEFASKIENLQVHPTFSTHTVPLAQVAGDIAVKWEDPIIWRYNRRRTITVQGNPPDGVPASALRGDRITEMKAMEKELPPGYELEWGGEYESSRDAQESLIPGMVPAAVIVMLIIVALFNAVRPLLIILFTVPFAIIGVTVGLLVTGQPFGFLALLGAMSLAGMMTKNAIVLLDEVDLQIVGGKTRYDAVVMAAVSRLRPVVLAAATTVLGVIPLLQDVFWVAMAVTIMFGLAFGTILTMVLVPVLYSCFFNLSSSDSAAAE